MKKIEDKIADIIEKISEIINYIHWDIWKKTGVSPLMAKIMEYIYENPLNFRSPAKIAEEMGLKRPTVTDALTSLKKNKYIEEKRFEKDKRYKILVLTKKGENFVKNENFNFKKILSKSISGLKKEEKEKFFSSLLSFVSILNKMGFLPIARICLNCENFVKDKYKGKEKPHFCLLLRKRMRDFDLNVNCPKNIKRRELCVKK
jgi:DNA-binding MarR family transcriptional regulator